MVEPSFTQGYSRPGERCAADGEQTTLPDRARDPNRERGLAVVLTAALILAACSAQENDAATAMQAPPPAGSLPDTAEPSMPNPLADTKWQLVEFRSMDDSQGVSRPDDPSKYVMELDADGTVAMRLNCNRATGTWTARAAAGGGSGSFEFGPLAMTRALCPPSSMDQQIASQAEYIRGYLVRDGNLYLSLMADGGIYAWEPRPGAIAFETEPDADIEAAIRAASPDYTREIADIGGNNTARYIYSRIDLNDDGKDEVFVYLLGSIFCGTGGCNLQLLERSDGGYALVNEFPTTETPVIVTTQKSNGWKDIWRYRAGGGAPANYIAARFDGQKYVDAEVVPADESPAGMRVLAGDFSFQQGIPLEPVD
jgi:heat shock protein HslJ